MLSMITGNLMAAYVIPDASESFFFMLACGIVTICIIYYIFLPNPLPSLFEEVKATEDGGSIRSDQD